MAAVVPSMAYLKIKLQCRVRVQALGDRGSILSSDSTRVGRTSLIGLKEKKAILINVAKAHQEKSQDMIDEENGRTKSGEERKWIKDSNSNDLEVLWDDGYGTKTVKDYLEGAREIIMPDGGPPRWFCPVECRKPLKNSPVLLFLPGFDGVGLGLTLHHKSLGKVFEVQCLHIPIHDRTPFEGLVKLVEETLRAEHASSPNKPIYLVGESLGGCLALAIAAHNPNIDLVVILVNPGTSFGWSQLPLLIPALEALPEGLCNALLYLLGSLTGGNPLKMAMTDIEFRLPLGFKIEQMLANLIKFQQYIPDLINIIPKETFVWKLKLLNSAAAFANSHLHAVKAEVLVIASGNNCILPGRDEVERLQSSLQNCTVRYFKDNGDTLLLEKGNSLLTIIKATGKYHRRSRRHDHVSDFILPSMSEFKCFFDQGIGFLRLAASSAMFSTMADGRIVRGLAGVPDEGPVILVGNHMLMGVEIYSLIEEFLRQKNILVHGIAHPILFSGVLEKLSDGLSLGDWFRVLGAVPATPADLFKLLSAKKHVLLYPGGAREALHKKGEEYKLIWPDEPEFVRMAARFGATIVPFGSVGEDDLINLNLDYNDLMKIPMVNDFIRNFNGKVVRVRDESKGEVPNEELFLPGFLPKTLPGRIYSLFGKPIETKGKKDELLKDKQCAKEMYLKVKTEVRRNIDYLLKKRDEDPCRNIFDRTLYRALYSRLSDIPAFDP